ncbi:MAG TPA: hypothetical protein GXZ86_00380 [Clostridiales bacterium]|jgi:hypothetical protein|nr:hypothetical protein [Clostridiales bacterium]
MKAYRKTIQNRINLFSLLILIAAALGVYDTFFASEQIKASPMFNFQLGLTAALALMSLVGIFYNKLVLDDEQKLKKQYYKENDERMKAVKAKAGLPAVWVYSALMIVAGMIVGYFNELIFITLIAAAVVQLLLASVIQLIYQKIL